jgi:hypothetical protein
MGGIIAVTQHPSIDPSGETVVITPPFVRSYEIRPHPELEDSCDVVGGGVGMAEF